MRPSGVASWLVLNQSIQSEHDVSLLGIAFGRDEALGVCDSQSMNATPFVDRQLTTSIQIATVPARSDNLCYIVFRSAKSPAAVIDPSETSPILDAVKKLDLKLDLVLNTHHHWDHVGGNLDLKAAFGAQVYCSAQDRERVPGADRVLEAGELFVLDGIEFEVIHIPGHTQGQIAFVIHEAKAAFVGDTVFSMGCGRLLEGRADQMISSLEYLFRLPDDYRLYFGHEYTRKNASFALSVEPDNTAIAGRLEMANTYLSRGEIVPAPTIAEEREVNPFVRLESVSIRKKLGMEQASDLEVFTKLRQMRDAF